MLKQNWKKKILAHEKRKNSTVAILISEEKNEFKVKINKGKIEMLYANKEKNKLRRNNREFPGCLVVRILGFHCHDLGSVPGRGTEVPQAMQHEQKKKKK